MRGLLASVEIRSHCSHVGAGHQHNHSDGAHSLAIAFLLNLSFTIFEVIGGLMTNSIAILSDAVHDAGDSLSLGLAWYLHRVSSRESDTNFTYGYRRFSALGALITGVLLVIGLGFVLANAVPRLANPEPVHGAGMLGIAVVGIVFNGAAALRLRGGSSLNERVASWHLLEDVLGWVAVLIGSVIVLFWNLPIVDPILSIPISAFVLWNVLKNLRKVFAVFLQRVPDGFDTDGFIRSVQALPKVKDVHHTHVWTLDGERHVLTTHIVVEQSATRQDVAELKCRVTGFVKQEAFEHVTIDVEIEGEPCASAT
jgi:cobalt-zinc-cadmium efflux system protein